jgi:hypothetical protein
MPKWLPCFAMAAESCTITPELIKVINATHMVVVQVDKRWDEKLFEPFV